MKQSRLSTVLLPGLMLFAMFHSAYTQPSEVGIYITVKAKRKCQNQLLDVDGKKYCLAPLPVLTTKDLSYISDIKLDLANRKYFNLVFTEAGAVKLKHLSLAYPNTQIALVVDKLIIGFLSELERLKTNAIKITSNNESEDNVEFVHEKLKYIIPVRK
jgi:hypothetical protein